MTAQFAGLALAIAGFGARHRARMTGAEKVMVETAIAYLRFASDAGPEARLMYLLSAHDRFMAASRRFT